MLYSRKFKDKHKMLSDKRNSVLYFDINPATLERDVKSENKMEKLRQQLISQTPHYQMKEEIESSKRSEYLLEMARHFYCNIKTMIDTSLQNQSPLFDDNLFREVLQHWKLAIDTSTVFFGREDVLRCVKQYVLTETDQPLVICGENGSGKTSILSKVICDINVAIVNGDLSMRTALIFRFIGQTQSTVTAQQLLYSLCHQLAYTMGRYRHEVPNDYKTLKLYFIDLLQRGEFAGMLIIILDSIECISPCDNGHKLEWLPSRIAKNVKIIVSASKRKPDTIERLENKCQCTFMELSKLASKDCEDMMKAMMNEVEKRVTHDQWAQIQSRFSECTLPVFVRIIFEEVCRTKSYDENAILQLGLNVEDCINHILTRTEKKFGKEVVASVLGYLTAANDGLSESELADLLSLDDYILNVIYEYWHPKLRRFPPYLIAELRQELEPYLDEKECDGILILSWKFRQFREIAFERYVGTGEKAQKIHSNIADYYLGKWSGTKRKPFSYPSMLMARNKITNPETEKCRLVLRQPNVYGTTKDDERYNLRKMTQLPLSLLHSRRLEELKSEVLCNFDYLYYRIKATSVQHLLTDFDICQDRESELIADALRMSGSALSVDINCLGMELTGRLLPHTKQYKFVEKLVYQCDLTAQKYCPLVPNCQIYSSPGGPLQYECDVGGNVSCPVDIDVFNTPDGILLTAKPYYSSRVRVWELSQGDPRPDMMMPVGEIHPTRDGRFLNVFQNDKSVKIYKSDCGEQHAEVDYGYGVMSDIEVSNKYLAFAIQKGAGPYVIDIERGKLLHKFSFHTHAVAISPEDSYLVFNSGRNCLLFELPLMERRCIAVAGDVPQDIIFISGSLTCFVLTKSKTVEALFFDTINRKYTCNWILTDVEIRECVLSHTEKYLMARSARCLHIVETESEKVVRKLSQLPDEIIVEPSSSFTGAGFTPNDKLVVASRYTFIAIWDANTGEALRVLQASISPILKVFTSGEVNKAVSLLEDNSFQVWNLKNIDRDLLDANRIFPGPVKSVAVSSENRKILCIESRVPEVKVVEMKDGRVADILQHSEDVTDKVVDALFSYNGRFIVTRGVKAETVDDDVSAWNVLRDDILWDIEVGYKVHKCLNNRYVLYNRESTIVLFVSCVHYSRFDWSENIYNVIIVDPQTGNSIVLDFPCNTEFVSPPTLVNKKSGYFTAVIQTCNRAMDVEQEKETSRTFEIGLLVRDLSHSSNENEILKLKKMLSCSTQKDQMLDAISTSDDMVVIVYGKGITSYTFETTKGIVRPGNIEKGAVIYDLEKRECLKHITNFLLPTSDINNIKVSKNFSVAMDTDQNVFRDEDFDCCLNIDTKFADDTVRMALDGNYFVGLSPNYREIYVVRTKDAVFVGHVFIHGRATCLEVANDDRTVVVGCEDGRIMILTLILELSDPIRELIEKIPSRRKGLDREKVQRRKSLIVNDIREISCQTPDLLRLKSKIQNDTFEKMRRPPSHTRISNGVIATQQNMNDQSEACCIQ
ncbi:hypothetical protein KUTeg_010127 [Tegillarca granosa]|uniref:NACHT domain-containing protein n=1 Tax=Tegillarca granosa TaxID=220873 RepID=A0ABQ9F5W2_TEGGR|nr:hypothetical protein KUTeg_010127 [Tegillarca granosa]